MATIRKRGDYQWQAIVRRKGWPLQSKTFNYQADAERWARQVESEMDRGDFRPKDASSTLTLKEALERYAKEVTPRKKGAQRELSRIKRWQSRPIAKVALGNISRADIASFRDHERARGMAENTIRIDMLLISSLFETARREWGLSVHNPVREVKLPAPSQARQRRLLGDEASYLVKGIEQAAPGFPTLPSLIGFAIETGMRQSETLNLTWQDVDAQRRIARLDQTKSGDPREVPLSPKALDLLNNIKGDEKGHPSGRIWNIQQDRLIRLFQKACATGRQIWIREHDGDEPPFGFLENLKFHDLRHESASRWASHLQAHELAKMFGWKTLNMALRYYHPSGETLADKLAKASVNK